MNFQLIHNVFYYLIKGLIVLCFFSPILLWIGNLAGLSKQQEIAMLERAEKKANAFIDNEWTDIKSDVSSETSAIEDKAKTVVAANSSVSKTVKGSNHPSHAEVQGIDVSHFQGKVNWDQIKQSGMAYSYIKATGGNTYVDPEFEDNWHGSRQAGIYRGAYHFFYAADDPTTQARHFLKTVGEIREQDLPPVVDVEITDHTDSQQIRLRLIEWLIHVEKASGRKPVIYTDLAFLSEHLNTPALAEYPLWIADYADKLGELPSHWKESGWKIWQYGQKPLQGIQGKVDGNHFNGNKDEFLHFIKSTQVN